MRSKTCSIIKFRKDDTVHMVVSNPEMARDYCKRHDEYFYEDYIIHDETSNYFASRIGITK